MARVLNNKELVNTRLATNYGGWMYCDKCNENIGYLCYSTYDILELKYKCNCGSKGSVLLDFEDSKIGKMCDECRYDKARVWEAVCFANRPVVPKPAGLTRPPFRGYTHTPLN